MYITISKQKSGGKYALSVADYISYLEKENKLLPEGVHEGFFNQEENQISVERVINEIDNNTAKLSRKEPRFYAITLSPSKSELNALKNTSEDLKTYTRKVMEQYVNCFNREIQGRPVRIEDILYFAKVEHKRYYKGTDPEVRQNQTIATKILEIKHDIRKIERGELSGNLGVLRSKIEKLEAQAPAQIKGQRIREGMEKPGSQSHIHIIVSRKDASNNVSLSPGSAYKASDVEFAGKSVKRGFDRDRFFDLAEKAFDRQFGYKRSFTQEYHARKLLLKHPDRFFKALLGLPSGKRAAAFKMLNKSGIAPPVLPNGRPSVSREAARKLKKAVEKAIGSASIEI